MTPQELVSTTAAPVGALGARFYFDPPTLAVGKEHDLDGFRWYYLGRGGVLGDVEASVVTSAFGYFAPALSDKIWNSAREKMAPRDAARRYLQCNADLGRQVLVESDVLAAFCDAAEASASAVSPAGLALWAGIAAEPLPDDLAGRAMQLIVSHRELRGSQHLAAIVGAGLPVDVAHALRRPDDVATFGWGDITIPDGAAETLAAVDRATDALSEQVYSTLSEEQRQAFADGVAHMTAAFED